MLGFVAALLVPFALLFFFSKQGRPFRAFGWAYLVFLAEMMFLHGKMYYVAPVYPMMFAPQGRYGSKEQPDAGSGSGSSPLSPWP